MKKGWIILGGIVGAGLLIGCLMVTDNRIEMQEITNSVKTKKTQTSDSRETSIELEETENTHKIELLQNSK